MDGRGERIGRDGDGEVRRGRSRSGRVGASGAERLSSSEAKTRSLSAASRSVEDLDFAGMDLVEVYRRANNELRRQMQGVVGEAERIRELEGEVRRKDARIRALTDQLQAAQNAAGGSPGRVGAGGAPAARGGVGPGGAPGDNTDEDVKSLKERLRRTQQRRAEEREVIRTLQDQLASYSQGGHPPNAASAAPGHSEEAFRDLERRLAVVTRAKETDFNRFRRDLADKEKEIAALKRDIEELRELVKVRDNALRANNIIVKEADRKVKDAKQRAAEERQRAKAAEAALGQAGGEGWGEGTDGGDGVGLGGGAGRENVREASSPARRPAKGPPAHQAAPDPAAHRAGRVDRYNAAGTERPVERPTTASSPNRPRYENNGNSSSNNASGKGGGRGNENPPSPARNNRKQDSHQGVHPERFAHGPVGAGPAQAFASASPMTATAAYSRVTTDERHLLQKELGYTDYDVAGGVGGGDAGPHGGGHQEDMWIEDGLDDELVRLPVRPISYEDAMAYDPDAPHPASEEALLGSEFERRKTGYHGGLSSHLHGSQSSASAAWGDARPVRINTASILRNPEELVSHRSTTEQYLYGEI